MYSKARNQKCPRLDYGDYIGPVEVRACDQLSKGRGLFATRDISQGELLLCEKALKICYADEVPMQTTINTVKNRFSMVHFSISILAIEILRTKPSLQPQNVGQ
jgi:hypothetical protein